MLLRSASTPILNSWCLISNDFSQDPESILIPTPPKTRLASPSISLSSSNSQSPANEPKVSPDKIKRASSESDLRDLIMPPPRRFLGRSLCGVSSVLIEEESRSDSSSTSLDRLFTMTGLGDSVHAVNTVSGVELGDEAMAVKTTMPTSLFFDGGLGSSGMGGKCGGGGDGNNGFSGFNYDNNSNNNDVTDAYYKNTIAANPGNGLILGNYARFLKEVKGDVVKAEEYCSRAILANPCDANILSLYADLIWHTHKDAQRAENYFDQAIQAAPDDCYVMASYARFLWDAEEEEEEEEEAAAAAAAAAAAGAAKNDSSLIQSVAPAIRPIATSF